MAALPAGCWSLASSREPLHDLVFVKLTDSSYRAIEDYLANKGKVHGSTPTIQFLSADEGKISIPNATSNGDSQPYLSTFRFSLASNSDLEGPQGSFQCLQAGSAKSIRSLGPMPTRMRVQANDDVYENTKHRMAIDVENQKSKCTRVIKPNQTDIGRKVKLKQQRPPPPRPPMNPVQTQQHNTSYGNPPSGQPYNNPHNTGINGYGGSGGGQHNHRSNGGNTNQNGSVSAYNGQPHTRPAVPATKPVGNPNLQKVPIKERLIHLLAYKPYKKPELYARINSEGIREKERNIITTILPQISSLKDNCYQLHRHLWNDVNEDWPHYTEEEKQILKRRKPQNLTPPLSSDSGHSPSPPPGKRLATPNQAGVPTAQPPIKKQRISHYTKPQDGIRESGERSPAALSNGYHSSTSTSGASSGERKNYSDEDTPPSQNSLTPNKNDNGFSLNYGAPKTFSDTAPAKQTNFQNSPSIDIFSSADKRSCSPLGKNSSPMQVNVVLPTQRLDKKSPDSTTLSHSPAPSSHILPDTTLPLPTPDYETQYTEITSLEQRRQYKSEFAAEHAEYLNLHSRIQAVAHRFTILEERLKGETPGGPNREEIKRQIFNEYQEMQADGRHQRDVDKFHYLHLKLAYIKRLVMEYDRLHTAAY